MFLGSYRPSFNLKSRRIALPKKLRDYLATSKIILSFGFEKCIFGFDIKAWEKESARSVGLPLTERSARDIRRFIFSGAEHIKLDDQGRFVIPNSLLEYAQIKKPTIIGAGDHFEIWDESIWQGHKDKLQRVNR
ncbi:MAG: Cell division protein MraZ [Candidatus Curtissbacteria bacterium GW2011_GWA1_40_47]|uniref:Transcriptional regulator MraZ n=1 Tax=Candidatus Curtissbacteria bacterium RIFOXYA1_FULL_41_14 TaxID=1797737 RepID=A0A1F5HAP7_9BACT|nr:MAG: Cell division protein MraZ [Candidatus Curtissbacteria bacterium GW2011_GWB1_40_28]KKR60562.1 MAG: Cell division protein MraZ [Candidatus Curtissbacteria bacterium GW2011_GWA2_40_31]KKR61168.1 MAG: cell division protein MraZ, MraZ protein [Microgenomates group bacterium GW2011_GWC1_40_35]KKR65484.1 MAG: Cell division protein MraZ [Candidatus Curtissbacteria bacterium GW2011_GWA1_40_47]KKR75885.1 MAG: Cell division protein MraZ [Candidatus Curtissbacteria bacterium GW2011_GWD1_40_8]KKS0